MQENRDANLENFKRSKTYICDNEKCGFVVQALRADLMMKASAFGALGIAGAQLFARKPAPGGPVPGYVDIPDQIWNTDPGSLDGYSQYFDYIHEHILTVITNVGDFIGDMASAIGDAFGWAVDALS